MAFVIQRLWILAAASWTVCCGQMIQSHFYVGSIVHTNLYPNDLPRRVDLVSNGLFYTKPIVEMVDLEPKLYSPYIEQYQDERAFQLQRQRSQQYPKRPVFIYPSGGLTGKTLQYTLSAHGPSRTASSHNFGAVRMQPDDTLRYRYTQVGVTYGRQANHHHKDGGYGPFDPHGINEYRLATSYGRTADYE